ncbi:MAG TPA: PHP-associated domain-containing protein [Methanomassiliicoccales archaeon]|nr:PHP-associated domain-containing protein [Methanomassiliicoccales archaeon]
MLSKADVHVHTKYSGLGEYGFLRFPESISNPEDVVKIARLGGINVLCITDHNSTVGAFKAQEYAKQFDDIHVVIGEEITTLQGEIIGLFLTEDIPMGLTLKETIARIRAQGGLVVAPHPFSYHVPAIGSAIFENDVDGIEVINGGHIDGPSNEKANDASHCGRWACMAGSDAHSLSQLGCAYTLFEGHGPDDFRRAIENKTTTVRGQPFPLRLGVSWSIGIVLEADKLMLRSLFGVLKGAEDDIIVQKIRKLSADKKIVALFGSMIFFTPPIPFLAAMLSKAVMRKKEERAHKIEAMRKRRLRSKQMKGQ